MKDETRHLSPEDLVAVADGTASSMLPVRARNHLETCAACRSDVAAVRRATTAPAREPGYALALLPPPGEPLAQVQPQDGLPPRSKGSFVASFEPAGLEVYLFSRRPHWLLAVYYPQRSLFKGVRLDGLLGERAYSKGWIGQFAPGGNLEIEIAYGRRKFVVRLAAPRTARRPRSRR